MRGYYETGPRYAPAAGPVRGPVRGLLGTIFLGAALALVAKRLLHPRRS